MDFLLKDIIYTFYLFKYNDKNIEKIKLMKLITSNLELFKDILNNYQNKDINTIKDILYNYFNQNKLYNINHKYRKIKSKFIIKNSQLIVYKSN
jgi:hypothetical protein